MEEINFSVISLLNESELICLHAHIAFVSMQLNGFNYRYQILIILIIYLLTVKCLQVLLFNTNSSLQHYSFVCSQLNGSECCYVSLTIQLNISHLFTHN